MLESLAHSNLFLVPLDAVASGIGITTSSRSCCVPSSREPSRSRARRCWRGPRTGARRTGTRTSGDRLRTAGRRRRPRGAAVRAAGRALYQSGRVATAERRLAWLEEHGALERNALAAVLGALLATLWGRPAEAERRASAAELAELRRQPARRQRSIDSWLALLRAHRCQRGVARMRADAELALELARPGEPGAAARLAAPRRLAVAGRRGRRGRRPPRRRRRGGPRAGNGRGGGGRRSAERAAIAIGRDAWVRAEELANQALREHPPVADGGLPDQRARLCRGRARRAAPRRSPARRGAPRQGAAAAAAAHLRDAVDRRPDAPGARARVPHDGRRGRRGDDASRDRRRCFAGNRTSAACPPRCRRCARACRRCA